MRDHATIITLVLLRTNVPMSCSRASSRPIAGFASLVREFCESVFTFVMFHKLRVTYIETRATVENIKHANCFSRFE